MTGVEDLVLFLGCRGSQGLEQRNLGRLHGEREILAAVQHEDWCAYARSKEVRIGLWYPGFAKSPPIQEKGCFQAGF